MPILIPIIGYQVLEQARGVEMQIGQHLTAYALGSLTLFLPYAFLTTYMIKYYNKGCLNIERELYTIRPISITQTTVTSSPERTQTNALYSDAAEISSHNIEESKRPIILTH